MDYNIRQGDEKRIVGLRTRTNNHAPDCGERIGGLWAAFHAGERARLSPRDAQIYAIYTNYETDEHGDYDFILGMEVAPACAVPEGMVEVVLPAGRFARFRFRGDAQKDLFSCWQKVWETPLRRAYTVDCEIYPHLQDPGDTDIEIHIALA